jgi:protein O-GlcNAc transferase
MLGRMLAGLLSLRVNSAPRCYRRATAARERGDWTGAVNWYRRALALRPGHAEAQNDLGVALCALHEYSAAREAFTQALAARGDLVPAHVNLGQLLQSQFRDYRNAIEHYRAALAIDPGQQQAIIGVGQSLYERGEVVEAIACLREAPQGSSAEALAHQFMLFMSNALPERDAQLWYAEHCLWGQRYADVLPRYSYAPAPVRARIRIGYVSADLREHATANFIRPILACHKAEEFEVFCYANSAEADALTGEMQRLAHCWRAIDGLDDAAAAQLIRTDKIDILIDVSGHTSGNRLLLFARKPAPLQVSFLGYLNTTGMKAIDYRICDSYADPPGLSDGVHTEKLLRLPRTQWCYRPPQDAPPVSELPALRRGHVTFASFNHIAKLNPRVLELWAELLRQVPGSRLLIMAVPDEAVAARIRRGLAGIEPDRVSTLGRLGRAGYWQQFAAVDIALDPFPYAGGATTCDTLWMGVPVVTLAGDYGFSRSGVTILANAGLSHLIAQTAAEYVGVARGLAGDLEGLARLRGGMRERLRSSPLTDAPAYVHDLESAYRNIWRDWCGRQGRPHA